MSHSRENQRTGKIVGIPRPNYLGKQGRRKINLRDEFLELPINY